MKVSYDWLKEFVDVDAPPQELARNLTAVGLNVELMSICAQGRSAKPFGSEYTKLNVWLAPPPLDGVTETAEGGWLPVAVTVQVPLACQFVPKPAVFCVCI